MAYSPDGQHIIFGSFMTRSFEYGMLRLVLQSENLQRDMLSLCGPLLTLLMGCTSSPDLMTAPFESGMLRRVISVIILQECDR